jgi:opacity protein-like surface antigen
MRRGAEPEGARRALMVLPLALVVIFLVQLGASPAAAYDPRVTFRKGAVVVTAEVGGGEQANLENFQDPSDIAFWNAGVRFSLLPFGPAGHGPLLGALELGLEPFVQRYTEPRAVLAGLKAVSRYHFLSLGRFVPYLELLAGAGGTDLRIREIDSTFTFIVEGGLGASVFITDRVALGGGYRFQHVSNANTSQPNRGFEAHTGVLGVSVFFP